MHNIKQFFLLLLLWMAIVYGMELMITANPKYLVLRYSNINNGFFGLLNFLQFYIYVRWIIPLFIKERHWRKLLWQLLPVFIGFILLKYFFARWIFAKDILYTGYRLDRITHSRIDLYTTFGEYVVNALWKGIIIVLMAFAYQFFMLWLQEDRRRAQLQQQKAQAESGFLKMQLNSHFLINSLNSIYSLALMGAPEVVTANKTLTALLAYMVEQPSDIDYRSPMKEEICYLQDFVQLQRLRTGCDECILFSVPALLPEKNIAPLLLVPFVENAFKHGITNQPEKAVTITLQCDAQRLVFRVHNFKGNYHKDKTGGIGLNNVRKRLQLIYPGQHQLDITETEQEYYCNLVVNW
ncbi:histidine kinase [Chitinophaga niastensis]|uniref:Histidine kinase n=1 Tax=Chitinophaga niastensis TaxID=536980 RepID=A0A2P8HQ83_CHINA|nr:histidine kinase [Chitinophaga niastensis]PSL48393.1 histidine kinase [Chitinophaga niastensis]